MESYTVNLKDTSQCPWKWRWKRTISIQVLWANTENPDTCRSFAIELIEYQNICQPCMKMRGIGRFKRTAIASSLDGPSPCSQGEANHWSLWLIKMQVGHWLLLVSPSVWWDINVFIYICLIVHRKISFKLYWMNWKINMIWVQTPCIAVVHMVLFTPKG